MSFPYFEREPMPLPVPIPIPEDFPEWLDDSEEE